MKQLCLLHGNCQGEVLAALLSASLEFTSAYEVEFVVNFTQQPVRPGSLARCGLYLHQHLGPLWGELSTKSLVARLPAGCKTICFPAMFFTGYWPFWSNRAGFDFADSFLDDLIDRGLGRDECLHLATRADVTRLFDLSALLEESFARERDKESLCDLPYVSYIEENFRDRQLFRTINHPGRELMLRMADAVLALLGMSGLPQAFREICPELYGDFELPMHPGVARFHGLAFAGEDRRYNIHGTALTYAEYAARYLDCRLAGRDDFLVYLTEG